MRVIVLGAGFGGLELATRLSEEFGDGVDVVLVDQRDGFVFGFSKLDVMFGRTTDAAVHHPYRELAKAGVQFVQAKVTAIDPTTREVETDAGAFAGDVLVVALGADVHPEATPGLVEGGHEFYTEAGAFALRRVLADFEGGRVIIGVTSTPFKCPPAPSETALLMHDHLVRNGVRDTSRIHLVMPLPVPIPPSPEASRALLEAFAERGIDWHPNRRLSELDPAQRVAVLDDGSEMPYELVLAVPVHRAPAVVAEAGLTVDGWVPVNPLTLETSFPGVYAIGDVTSVGTPKAGVFSERQGAVAADRIADVIRGRAGSAEYDGRGMCYLEFGDREVARVEVTFVSGHPPTGTFVSPSEALAAEKVRFGSSRARRWFGREWSPGGPGG
ncbi:MAG TPA: FAD-dependent oxidoreductase [Acidimicrobiales bacterium]|jgi:sulfide:quinone oxidoreductase|nr:FAD-dependent oxidoreductase [Acidimicrobiales bacterium]